MAKGACSPPHTHQAARKDEAAALRSPGCPARSPATQSQPGFYLRSGLEKLCTVRGALVRRNMEQRAAWVSQWRGWKRNWKGAGARVRLDCGRGGAEGGTAAGDIITNAGKAGLC